MRLAVFDIDGTLTLGGGLGTDCFFTAFEEVFGVRDVDRSLAGYEHSTDCGIGREAATRVLGRSPTTSEMATFKNAYLTLLQREIGRAVPAYRPVPGAERVLDRLEDGSRAWRVAIATGNWRRAALLKLASAGVSQPGAAACSEDGDSRAGVLAAAVRRAAELTGVAAFERVVYVGDQPWDLEAARIVGTGFVGIGSDERGSRLRARGAEVVPGYEDFTRFLDVLEAAADAGASAAATLTMSAPMS